MQLFAEAGVLWHDPFMRILSCGIIVSSPAGILMARATGSGKWDLPKGKIEEGETPLACALRETWEETGLDLSPYKEQMQDLGRMRYLPKKDLHLFRLNLPEPLSLDDCACHTFIELTAGKKFPETNGWAWIARRNIQAQTGRSMGILLQKIGVTVTRSQKKWRKRREHTVAQQQTP